MQQMNTNMHVAERTASPAMQQQQQQSAGWFGGYGGLMGMNSYSAPVVSAASAAQVNATPAQKVDYTDAEFDQMFEEAAGIHAVGQQEDVLVKETFAARVEERIQPVSHTESLKAEINPIAVEEERKAEERDQEKHDADELAKTAGQLLDTLSQDTSQKFQESQFVALMRKLRDKTVKVEDGKMVEV